MKTCGKPHPHIASDDVHLVASSYASAADGIGLLNDAGYTSALLPC